MLRSLEVFHCVLDSKNTKRFLGMVLQNTLWHSTQSSHVKTDSSCSWSGSSVPRGQCQVAHTSFFSFSFFQVGNPDSLPKMCLTFSKNSIGAAVKLDCATNSRLPLGPCDKLWVWKREFTTVHFTADTPVVFGAVQVHLTVICQHCEIENWYFQQLTEFWPLCESHKVAPSVYYIVTTVFSVCVIGFCKYALTELPRKIAENFSQLWAVMAAGVW